MPVAHRQDMWPQSPLRPDRMLAQGREAGTEGGVEWGGVEESVSVGRGGSERMKIYWGHKKRGILSAKGFACRGDGRLMLWADSVRTFRFYGVMLGLKFFGYIAKEDK